MMEMKELLERVESFDEHTPKLRLLEVLNRYPNLKKSLNNQLSLDGNQEWIEKAEKERFFFVLYDDSWKASNRGNFPNKIGLKFMGIQNIPVISVDIHRKPVWLDRLFYNFKFGIAFKSNSLFSPLIKL